MRITDIITEKHDLSTAYHGTVKANRGEKFFDTKKIHPKDQFLGEGWYFTLDRDIAHEYANIRAIKPLYLLPGNHPANKGGEGYYRAFDPNEGPIVTTGSVMRGVDVEGNPIINGQELLTADLSGLQKTFWITNNLARVQNKAAQQKLVADGYDSIAFKDFTDRSKQIMVYPEFIDRVKIVSRGDF